jgi:sulfhydrogenase subunit beta (sulfur reductase)
MVVETARTVKSITIGAEQFPQLIAAIAKRGYELFGPKVREGAIVYDRLNSAQDLPRGWKDEQQAGKYRLAHRRDKAYFGYNAGPHSWKKFLHPPVYRLWQCTRDDGGFHFIPNGAAPAKRAFIGVRPCELQAIAVLDKVLAGGASVDPEYKSCRENLFIVAVNCGQAGGTCFCASMNTGPQAVSGYDLALTEILAPQRHDFLVEIGTRRGGELAEEVPHREANANDIEAAERIVSETRRHMGRTMAVDGLKELLYRNYENPRWDDVATRCMTCANCTMVCPTCFCTTIEDVTDLAGQQAERWRKWDSCFTTDFSYIHGGSVRSSAKSRYRQWITHKLAAWVDQFGEFGCVGCGRCITWCPVGIDITEEVRALRDSERAVGHAKRKEAS